MSKEYTKDEINDKFMNYVWNLVDYWNELPNDKSTRERISGTVFSLLAMLDGCTIDLPGFIVAPLPHPEDKQFNIDNNENYYPENHLIEDKINSDLGGSLHDSFYSSDPKKDVNEEEMSTEQIIMNVLNNNLDLELSGRNVITPLKFKKISSELSKKLNRK